MRKQLYLLLFTLLGFSTVGLAQIERDSVSNSPYTAVYNHLYYLQNDSYEPVRAALSLPGTATNKTRMAIQLKRILDGKGYYIDLNLVPNLPNYRDSTQNSIYYLVKAEPRIYLELNDGSWKYSRSTMTAIPTLFNEVYPIGTGIVSQFSGPFWSFAILGLTAFQWIGLLVLFGIGFLISLLIRKLSSTWITNILKNKFGLSENVHIPIRKLTRSLGLLLAVRVISILLPILQLPIQFNVQTIKVLDLLSICFIIFIFLQVASIVLHYMAQFTRNTSSKMDDQLLPIISRFVHILIWGLGIFYLLDYLNVNVTALLAGISIGGLAIALAAQDTVKNFFGSVMIFLDRPFKIGDAINFDGTEGTVEEVGMRSTRIRSFSNTLFYVPNGILADKVINNIGLRKYRRFKMMLGITYDTPPDKIDKFVLGLREIIKKHPDVMQNNYQVHLNDLADSSIQILVYCFVDTEQWNVELNTRQDLIMAFLLLAQDMGIDYAFPSQTVYVQREASDDVPVALSEENIQDQIQQYFNRNKN